LRKCDDEPAVVGEPQIRADTTALPYARRARLLSINMERSMAMHDAAMNEDIRELTVDEIEMTARGADWIWTITPWLTVGRIYGRLFACAFGYCTP
jgi:hypothetical protein